MGYYSRITGERFDFASREEQLARRIARMRKVIWLGIGGLKRAVETDGGQLVMYTLTYARIGEWAPRHISGFCRWLRGSGQVDYLWVAELQRRGAVHYHVLARLPAGQRWIKPSAEDGGWAKGFTWVTMGIHRPYYIMKYLQKASKNGRETTFPKGLRLYGVARGVIRKLAFDDAVSYRECQLPRWAVDDQKNPCDFLSVRRVSGGVLYRSMVEYSPYATSDLGDIASLGRAMYNCYWGGGLLPQQ